MLRKIIRDPSLMSGQKIIRKENVVTVGDYTFECSSVEVAKKLDCRLIMAKFAWGMTTRGKAQSRENFSFGKGHGTSTGWTQHN